MFNSKILILSKVRLIYSRQKRNSGQRGWDRGTVGREEEGGGEECGVEGGEEGDIPWPELAKSFMWGQPGDSFTNR